MLKVIQSLLKHVLKLLLALLNESADAVKLRVFLRRHVLDAIRVN